jgi:hypothetical protein
MCCCSRPPLRVGCDHSGCSLLSDVDIQDASRVAISMRSEVVDLAARNTDIR